MVRLACLVSGDLNPDTDTSFSRKRNEASSSTIGKQHRQREMFVITPVVSHCANTNALVGNQVRESLRTWVTPPDPSTNHTIACGIQHDGSAQWFFRGGIFSKWKCTGSLLWIYGKRMFFLVYLRVSVDEHSYSQPAPGRASFGQSSPNTLSQ